MAAPPAPDPEARAVLLWQIRDLIRQLIYARTFWSMMDPKQFGAWSPPK